MQSSRHGLGQVIRELREARAPRLSQEELGRQAGYRTGAGVSMSRIENGVTRPGPRRLEGIASALGVTVRELEARSAGRSSTTNVEPPHPSPSRGAAGESGSTPGAAPDRESTKDRLRRIQADFERRNAEAARQGSAFNAAHDRARDGFFLALVGAVRTIGGLPAPDTRSHGSTAGEEPPAGPAAEASLRRQVVTYGIAATLGSGAGAAAAADEADSEAAYNAVVATAILVPAPSAALPEHPVGATPGAIARATRALLVGGSPRADATGFAAGAMLTGFLASAASPLFAATTLMWLARRSRRQNEQLRLELDQAEANLTATERGFDAVMDILGRATERLSYIAVHGGHALARWQAQLPSGPAAWTDLSHDQQRQYLGFVEVAACLVCVDTINMTELLAATGPHQSTLMAVADDILTLARRDVELLV